LGNNLKKILTPWEGVKKEEELSKSEKEIQIIRVRNDGSHHQMQRKSNYVKRARMRSTGRKKAIDGGTFKRRSRQHVSLFSREKPFRGGTQKENVQKGKSCEQETENATKVQGMKKRN